MPRPRFALLLAVGAFVALFLVFPAIGNLLTDWWWYQEVGYQVVFTRQLWMRLILFLVVGIMTAAVVYTTLRVAQRARGGAPQLVVPFGETAARPEHLHRIPSLGLPLAAIIGSLAGLAGSSAWSTMLQFVNAVPFGVRDPVFARDVGYYVFTLPAVAGILGFLTSLATIALFISVPVYALGGQIVAAPGRVRIDHRAGMHLSVVVGILFVLTAVRLWVVDVPNLVYSTTGPLVGASYTDLHATRPAIYLSAMLALAAATVVVAGGVRDRLLPYGAGAIGGYLVLAFLARTLAPSIMQKFVVAPTELTREMPYLGYHIAATRQAWGLDSVETRELGGEATLTQADLKENAPTLDNVRLWDRDPLLQTFGQLQEIRTYYDFVSVDDDRYWIDGKYRQVLLSPRELNAASLPTRTFINERLTFTHGMGLTLGPVNQVTVEGLPVLFVKDLPPASTVSLKVTRPQVYFGELTNEWVVVGTKQREFDHPSGEDNVYESYKGTGGVRAGGLLKRLVFATHFGESNVLFSQDIGPDSRILYVRNVRARARMALPMLQFDRDPYMVITKEGRLVWMLDAYTATDRYPYAMRIEDGTNYMRNSVKVVIDAYDGSITAYRAAPNDPILRTWDRIFPGVFHALDSMPPDVRAHVRYPDELYRAQAALYTTYHMAAPEEFYHREDQWQIPTTEQPDGAVPFMRHIIMRLPDEKSAEFIYMVPFSPRGKDNLAAWMIVRNDSTAYGKLRVYRLSRQSLVFGPRQIENRINQNTEISRQVSLWDQRGSKVLRGDLLVIPIESSLLYVQPLYLQAEGGRIPELKRVVVAYQNQVAMEETLEGALAALFGSGAARGGVAAATPSETPAAATVAPGPSALQPLIDEARRHYQSAMDAQRDGDWARYGTEIKELGRVLDRIAAGNGTSRK
ncbi:MAG: UPF0182 family protein [Gemmatimonadaceae bacterium]